MRDRRPRRRQWKKVESKFIGQDIRALLGDQALKARDPAFEELKIGLYVHQRHLEQPPGNRLVYHSTGSSPTFYDPNLMNN